MNKRNGFKKCCISEIKRIWNKFGGSMNIVRYEGKCPECGHYIGLTQTDIKTASNFLKQYEQKST
jgi:hypothetical protein